MAKGKPRGQTFGIDPDHVWGQAIVEGVRCMLDTFGRGNEDPPVIKMPDHLVASFKKIQEGPPAVTTYLMVSSIAALITWIAEETGRSQGEVLDSWAGNYRDRA
jgi:hypothetical protein